MLTILTADWEPEWCLSTEAEHWSYLYTAKMYISMMYALQMRS
jgi:hypothetical protein